jgi:16S rRNA (guanine527-N7)-methyltransferase
MSGKSGADRILEEGLQSLSRSDPAAAEILHRRTDVKDLLNIYIDEIERFNPAYGLVSVKDREELVIRHILDSLAPLGIVARLYAERNNTHALNIACDSNGAHLFNIADAGSGAGLPGIPLAIALREMSFTLIERMGRRAGFLRGTLAVLGLSNATVREEEMEQTARRASASERFDLIVFRAFKALEGPILKILLGLLGPGGSLAAYKGRMDKIAAEMTAVEKSGIRIGGWEAIPLHVPLLNEERHLVIIRGSGQQFERTSQNSGHTN